MAGTIIKSGLNTFQPVSFARDRQANLYIFNGLERPQRWDGLTAATQDMGITAPTSAPSVASPVGGAATAGDYLAAYQYVAKDGAQSSLSDDVTVTAAANDQFAWTGLVASTESRVTNGGFVRLWRTTAAQTTTFYLIATLGHNGTITSGANSGGFVQFTVPAGHNLLQGARFTVSGSSVAGYNTTHTVTSVTSTTVLTTTAYTSNSTGGTWVLEGYSNDVASDDTISATTNTALPVLIDGLLNARRFGVPPSYKAVAAPFQDRLWLGVDVEYNVGTIAVTNGSATVTGTGTAWTSAMAGRLLFIPGETVYYTISSASATSITLSENFAGSTASGLSYTIRPDLSERLTLFFSEADEFESIPATNAVQIQENFYDLQDELVGLAPHGTSMFLLMKHRILRLRFTRQPQVDTSINPFIDNRGCFNQRCWDVADELMFLMDAEGPYAFTGQGGYQGIGEAVQDYWRNSTIDFAKSKWFSVDVNPLEGVVRFRVAFTGDSGTRPTRSLDYCYKTGCWTTCNWNQEVGGAARVDIAGKQRVVAGMEDDEVLLLDQGTTDIVTAQVRGTATSATSTTLTDSTASFATGVVNAPIAIISGPGKGDIRRIITRNSGTQVTVNAAWSETPTTESVYLIGAIEYRFKTGLKKYAVDDEANMRAFRLAYQPTTNQANLDMRRYLNHNTTPENCISTNQFANVSWANGEPDYVVDLKSARTGSLQTASGFAKSEFNDGSNDNAIIDRWLACEIRGFQGDDRIELYNLDIQGAD